MVENHQGAQFRPAIRFLTGPILLFIIVTGTFWKVTLSHQQYTWLESPDLTNQVLPWLQYEAGEFHRGHFPLWDPYEWGGQSLIGQAQPAVAYPLNWLLYSLPLKNGWIQRVYVDWFFVLIHYLAGLFCYWLCRDLGRSVVAALLGGSAFALSGWMGNTDWPQMLNGGVWAPLVFLFFFRMMRGFENPGGKPAKNAALSGAMLGIAFLSGHHQIPMFTGLAIGGCWLYWLWEQRESTNRRQIGLCAAAFAAMFFLAGAFQILPASEYGKQAVRWVGANHTMGWTDVVPYRVHASLSMPPASILGIVIGPFSDHTTPYTGFAVLLMAVSGVAAAWRNIVVRILAAVASFGFFLAMGQWNIFHGLIYAIVPEVEKARNVSFGIFVFGFAVSALAAFGVDLFLRNEANWKRAMAGIAGVCGFVLAAATFFLSETSLPKTGDYNLILFNGLVAMLLGGVLLCWQQGTIRNGGVAVLLLALIEFGTTLGWGYRPADAPDYLLKKMSAHSDIAQWLRQRPGPVRVELDDNEITYNFGDWYGIEVYGGYLASLSTNVVDTSGEYPARVLMGVKYDVGRKPIHPDKETEVFHDSTGLKIWEHEEVFPRVWSVHATRAIPRDQMDAAYNAGLDRLRREAFFIQPPVKKGQTLAPPPQVEKCSGDSVDLIRRDANEVEIDAQMQCKGMVVAAETFDKGWSATVDGAPTPVYEAYATARAVVVPQGHHRILMRFYPRSVLLGAAMTGIALLAVLVLAFL